MILLEYKRKCRTKWIRPAPIIQANGNLLTRLKYIDPKGSSKDLVYSINLPDENILDKYSGRGVISIT
jgi:hypothetical protein